MTEKSASIVLEGNTLRYTVLRTRRNRYVRITVRPERGVLVTIPWRFPEREVAGILREKARWIVHTLKRIEQEHAALPPMEYRQGKTLPIFGRYYPIHLERIEGARARVAIRNGVLRVQIPRNILRWKDPELIRSLVLGWFRFQAQKFFPARVAILAKAMRVTYGNIRIKDLRSRWGSCSREGNLNFNLRLLAAPAPVVDYVIIHELAHRLQLNHSERFWQIVARHCPRYQKHKRWLKENAGLLGSL